MKPFAVLIVLLIFAVTLALSAMFLFGFAKQLIKKRDKDYANALRINATRLQEAGYYEAADHFREYARILDASPEERERLRQS